LNERVSSMTKAGQELWEKTPEQTRRREVGANNAMPESITLSQQCSLKVGRRGVMEMCLHATSLNQSDELRLRLPASLNWLEGVTPQPNTPSNRTRLIGL